MFRLAVYCGLLLGCLIWPTAAPAQADTARTRAALVQRLYPGTTLRLRTDSDWRVGRVLRVTPDTLYLDNGPVPIGAADQIWLRQRSTRDGMKLGAIIGAPVGLAVGGFFIWLGHALCEASCHEFDTGSVIGWTLGFGAFGLVSGGALGAAIGASIPKWVEIGDRRAHLSESSSLNTMSASTARTIGSISLTPAMARFSNADESGFGWRVAYVFHTKHVGVGPEIGKYGLGSNLRERRFFCDSRLELCTDTVQIDESAFHAGGVARIGAGTDRKLEPFGTLGAGVYSWENEMNGGIELVGYSVGAGLQLRSRTGKQSVFGEARWQSKLSRSGDTDRAYGFYTIGIGGSLAW